MTDKDLLDRIEEIVNRAIDEKPADNWDHGWRSFAVMLKTQLRMRQEQDKGVNGA